MLRICSIKDCEKKQVARGWCAMHWSRWKKTGTTTRLNSYSDGCKVEGCDKKHSSHGFCRIHSTQHRKGEIPVLFNKCKFCGQDISDRIMSAEFHRSCVKQHQRNMRFIKEYGITLKEYESLAAFQQHKCAICNQRTSEDLHVDHDHHTGVVRGLLCGSCNRGLGLLEDDIYRLVNAKEYLMTPPMLVKRVYGLTNQDIRK